MSECEAGTSLSTDIQPEESSTTTMDPQVVPSKTIVEDVDELQNGVGEASASSSKELLLEEGLHPDTDTESCTSTRRNSFVSSTSDSDLELALNSLFRTPTTTSTTHSSSINSPPRIDGTENSAPTLLDGIDVLLQRITSERFAELRNIQLSERPVTGGNARGNIESFMRRAVHGPTEEEQLREDAANRPDHVTNEQQYLRQQSVVQSSLQNEFRTILERTLLARVSPTSEVTNVQRENERETRNAVGGTTFRARLEALFGERNSGTRTDNRQPRPRNRNVPRPPAPPSNPLPNIQQQYPQEPHQHQQQQQQQQEQQASANITIEAGMELLAQSIADDLNRLESLHVVSGMLRGNFRSNLEQMVQTRISNDQLGTRTQQFIQSLPGRRPQSTAAAANNVGAYTPSQAAINQGVSAELNSLKSQMDEMKRMLQMSMEIQMDTQRAVRQEVAAIFSSFTQQFAATTATTTAAAAAPPLGPFHPPVSTPVSSGCCVICCERSIDTVLYQCGHMCVCVTCGQQLKMDGHNCPMCRAPIRDVIRAYQTQTPQ